MPLRQLSSAREKRGTLMPDDSQVVRGIDYKSTFPFTLIFKSFRIAIHPSKIVLALIALILIYVGGNFLDKIWPAGSLAVPNELDVYAASRMEPDPAQAFVESRDASRQALLDDYKHELQSIGKPDGNLQDIKWAIVDRRNKEARRIEQENDPTKQSDPQERRRVERERDDAIQAIYRTATLHWYNISAVEGTGLWRTFLDYEIGAAESIVGGVFGGHWIGQAAALDGIVDMIFVGPSWAIGYHAVYFAIFGIYCLILWSVFGGAIARIAAVQVARDEKISFRQALSFSTAKFLSFVSAPIIPMLIIVIVGLVVAVGGLVFNLPFFGPIIGGALYFLALVAGFVMTLVLIGLVGGFNLMYPTIAIEGSDSFDAISRSFSYLYARPWQLLFYSLVALVYGALCFVFVRFFLRLMLSLTHLFTGLFILRHADNTAPLWPTIWPNPMTAPHLMYTIDFLTLSGGQTIGAGLLGMWIYLTVAVLGAFVISLYFSANTIIYVLMRHEVDATELDDVYVEESEEELSDSPAVTIETTTVSVSGEPAAPTPEDPPAAE
jgi:hypothetical protein